VLLVTLADGIGCHPAVVELRQREPVFRRRDFLKGTGGRIGLPDVVRLDCTGEAMTDGDRVARA
jgi:hypothetical protein